MIRRLSVVALLVLLNVGVYWPVGRFEFVFDDIDYILNNSHIQNGFRLEDLKFIFSSAYEANWYPLTWLSHLVDIQFFGANPGPHHLVNLILHVMSTAALFLTLRAFTGALWRSAFVAALFAVHPLHVETVSWIVERKGVLSGLFWASSMAAYLRYVRDRRAGSYALALGLFLAGLMTKPTLVTLPFVLLLLDYWPLGRFKGNSARSLMKLLLEKLPFLVLSVVSSLITYRAQLAWGTVASFEAHPFGLRVSNALVSMVNYLANTFWPFGLAIYYPYPERVAPMAVLASVVVLAGITVAVFWAGKRAPYGAMGWLWFVGCLVPVIGLVQVGDQARADRYTYLPLTGIFLILAWGIGDSCVAKRVRGLPVFLIACSAITFFAGAARAQVSHWKNNHTLFEHAIAVTTDNFIAHNNFGSSLASEGQTLAAIQQFSEAVRINPRMDTAYFNLGVLLGRAGRYAEAEEKYRLVLRINPGNSEAHINLGCLLRDHRRAFQEAAIHFRAALRPGPFQELAYLNLGATLEAMGDSAGARVHYQEALRLKPTNQAARMRLAIVDDRLGRNTR